MNANKPEPTLYPLINVALLLYLLAALFVEYFSGLPRGDFTDYFCQVIPPFVPPVALALGLFGIAKFRTYRYWVLLPHVSLLLSFCFPATISWWLLGGYVPGR